MGGMNPDFTSTNGNRKVIEVFGNYYHSPEVTGRSCEQEEQERISKFVALDFDCLVIWEYELTEAEEDPTDLINRILEFNNAYSHN